MLVCITLKYLYSQVKIPHRGNQKESNQCETAKHHQLFLKYYFGYTTARIHTNNQA